MAIRPRHADLTTSPSTAHGSGHHTEHGSRIWPPFRARLTDLTTIPSTARGSDHQSEHAARGSGHQSELGDDSEMRVI